MPYDCTKIIKKESKVRHKTMDLLLIIRGLAALSVVVWHAEGYRGNFPSVVNIPGRTAVWLFFGISGYVISYGFIHKRYRLNLFDLRDFYVNRFLRIYPLFLTLSALCWVTGLIFTGSNPIGLKDLPGQLFALQFNQNYILCGVFWTLGIEIHFYLLAPLLVTPFFNKKSLTALLFAFILYVIMVCGYRYAVIHFGWSFDGRNIISNLPHFFIGMIACRIVSTFKPNVLRVIVSIMGACILLGYTNWLYHNDPSLFWSVRGILLVDSIILLFIFAHASCEWGRFKSHPIYNVFAFFGTLSYGIYAQHGYLLNYFPKIIDHVIVLIVFSIFMAYVSYRLIELPALKLKRCHSPIV